MSEFGPPRRLPLSQLWVLHRPMRELSGNAKTGEDVLPDLSQILNSTSRPGHLRKGRVVEEAKPRCAGAPCMVDEERCAGYVTNSHALHPCTLRALYFEMITSYAQ